MPKKKKRTKQENMFLDIFVALFIDRSIQSRAVFFSNEEKYRMYMQEICKGGERRGRCVLPSPPLVFIQSSLS